MVSTADPSRVPGMLLILLAATCWGVAGGIGGILVERGWDPVIVSFYRGALTLLFAGLWLLSSSQRTGLKSARLWLWSASAGAGVAGAFSLYFLGMRTGSVAVAATLLYSAPIFVFLTDFLLGRQRVTAGRVLGLAVVMIGVALLSGVFSQTAVRLTVAAIAAGLLSGVCYAVFIISFKKATGHGSTQVVMTVAFTVQTALLLGPANAGGWSRTTEVFDVVLIALLGMLGGCLSFFFYIAGIRRSPAGAAALLGMAEPLMAAAFAFVFLDQLLAPPQLLGAIMVIVTVTMLNARLD